MDNDRLSVFWWNVKNLKDADRARRVVSHIQQSNPDIFALGEVVGEPAYRLIAAEFPDYSFYMTYGKQAQEMLVGVRRTVQIFFSQLTEFKSGNEFIRPAVLLTVSFGSPPLNLLFVHLKSFPDPLSLGYRHDFFLRLGRLKQVLDKRSGGNARFVICGDFNLQGMNFLEKKFIDPGEEFHHVQNQLGDVGILFAEPTQRPTWLNATAHRRNSATLDYVAATSSATIPYLTPGSQVQLGGWSQYPDRSQEQREFAENVSDHASLYFEISL